MEKKIITKSYKPEIDCCPICGSKLKYRYTVSNKVIQFSQGKEYRIKNMGYSCSNEDCTHANMIYSSQTATKLCYKGYTYSAKILASILYYKHIGKSRDEICDELALNGVEMSDRNVDVIYEKLSPILELDYKKNIEIEYEYMKKEFKTIALSIDTLALPDGYRYIIVRNFFSSSVIGAHITKYDDTSLLDEYLNDKDISLIITVRPITQSPIYKGIVERVDESKTKIISFLKY